jgi:hypothetical protein
MLIAAGSAGAYGLRGRIALAVTKRTLPGRMRADPVAEMPDGLHAAICGSGSPVLWIARDGDLYSLPADGDEVERSNLIGRGPGA